MRFDGQFERDYAAGPFETGMKRFCVHSKLEYLGMYSVRDIDGIKDFQTESAITGAREFALGLLKGDIG